MSLCWDETGATVNTSNMRTFNEINYRLPKSLTIKRTKAKVCTYEKDDPHFKNTVVEIKSFFSEIKLLVV